jgi:hypothetical protein
MYWFRRNVWFALKGGPGNYVFAPAVTQKEWITAERKAILFNGGVRSGLAQGGTWLFSGRVSRP